MSLPKPLKVIKDAIEEIMPFDGFEEPIFIISPPRSGSTLLFECLVQFKELFHISYEADLIWWKHFPYHRLNDPSDYIGENEASLSKIYELKRSLRSRASLNILKLNKSWNSIPYHFGIKPIRFIDKTISNCFHLEFLNKAFPDAKYIFLLRDPRSVISSMIEGWECDFQKPQLENIIKQSNNTTISNWSYPAPPGWQDIINESLPKICAWSWMKHIEYPLSFFHKNKTDAYIVKYEDLTKNTYDEVSKIANKFDLNVNEGIKAYLENPKMSSTTVSAPAKDKWKLKRKSEIESIIPMIEGLALKLGYDVNAY